MFRHFPPVWTTVYHFSPSSLPLYRPHQSPQCSVSPLSIHRIESFIKQISLKTLLFRQGYFGDHFVGKPDWEIALLKTNFCPTKTDNIPAICRSALKLSQEAAASIVQINFKEYLILRNSCYLIKLRPEVKIIEFVKCNVEIIRFQLPIISVWSWGSV